MKLRRRLVIPRLTSSCRDVLKPPLARVGMTIARGEDLSFPIPPFMWRVGCSIRVVGWVQVLLSPVCEMAGPTCYGGVRNVCSQFGPEIWLDAWWVWPEQSIHCPMLVGGSHGPCHRPPSPRSVGITCPHPSLLDKLSHGCRSEG